MLLDFIFFLNFNSQGISKGLVPSSVQGSGPAGGWTEHLTGEPVLTLRGQKSSAGSWLGCGLQQLGSRGSGTQGVGTLLKHLNEQTARGHMAILSYKDQH